MSSQTRENSSFYALLIGIDYYFPNRLSDGSSYPSLNGCVRDITLVEKFLKDRLKLPDNHIFKLTASNVGIVSPLEERRQLPTYENMTAAFSHLREIAQTGDQVYIHYSGHGGRTPTLFPQLKGSQGLDESLVPTDIGSSTGQYLRDVELAYILKAMVDKGLVVTLVLDSCHSGGATRGQGGAAVRGVSTIDRTPRSTQSKIASSQALFQVWYEATRGASLQAAEGSDWLPEAKGYVLLAACRPSESAYEYAFNGQEKQGALTYWLLDSLKHMGSGLTYKLLHDRLIAKVHSQFELQTPQLVGEGKRIVFDCTYVQRRDAVNVMKVDMARQRLLLNTGRAQAVEKGAQFAVYAPSTSDFGQVTERLAIVEIVQAGATQSWAKIINFLRPDHIEQGFQAVLLDPGTLCVRRTVRLVQSSAREPILAHETALREVEEALTESRFVEVIGDETAPDFQIIVNEQGVYEVWDPSGAAIPNLRPALSINDPQAPRRLAQRLEHLAKYRMLQQFDNTDAPLLSGKLVVELLRKRVPDADMNVPKSQAFEACPSVLGPDEHILLSIKNNSSHVLNVTVLDMKPDWSISQFYPDDDSYALPFDPGQEMTFELSTELPDGYTDAKDILKVFATLGSTNFHWLELPALDQPQQSRETRTHARLRNSLEELLETLAIDGPQTRQLKPSMYVTEEWITTQVEVCVRQF